MKRWPIMVGIVAYFVFCVAAWEIYREPVDEKLEQRALAALAGVAESNPSVEAGEIEFRGMRGVLRGIADAEIAERARQKIEDSVGWGMLELEIAEGGAMPDPPREQVPSPPAELPEAKVEPTFALRPGTAQGTWIMSGEFADDDLIDALVLGTRDACEAVEWVDAENLRRADVKEVAWGEKLPALVTVLITNAKHAALEIDAEGVVFVKGDVSSLEGKARILEVAENVSGGELVEQLRAPGYLVVAKMGDKIMVEGLLPDGDSTGKLLAAIQEKFMLGPAIDREGLTVAEGVSPSTWLPRAVEAIPVLLGEIEAGQMEISEAGVEVFVGVRSEAAAETIRKGTGELAGGEIPLGSVEVVVLEAPQLGVVLTGDKIVLSGRLPSGAQRAAVANSIRGYLSTVEIDNKIEVDENVWDPKWFSAADSSIPEFLQIASGLGNARVQISGDQLRASARLPSDELKEPIELLFSPFGRAGVQVDLTLEVLAQPRLIIRYSEPKIRVSGRLKDAGTKTKITRALVSVFPQGEVEDLVVLDSNVAESGWDVMVIDLVSLAMTELKDAGIDLRPGKVRIEGEIGSEKARAALEIELNNEFGAAFEIESAIKIPDGKVLAEPRFELAGRDGKWAIVGMIASNDEKVALIDALKAIKSTDELIDELEVTEDVAPSPWVGEIAPIIASLAEARDPWMSVFRGTVIVEGEFLDKSAKQRLGDAGTKLKGLKFEDASTMKPKVPGVVVPPPPNRESAPPTQGS